MPMIKDHDGADGAHNTATRDRLLTLLASNHHGEDAGRIFLLALAALAGARATVDDQIRESRVVEDTRCRVSDVEKHLVQGAVRQIAVDQFTQLLGVAEGRQRTVNQANDLAEMDVGRFAAQLVAALGPAYAF